MDHTSIGTLACYDDEAEGQGAYCLACAAELVVAFADSEES